MSRHSKGRGASVVLAKSKVSWFWARRIKSAGQDEWISRLESAGCANWAIAQKPDRPNSLLTAYVPTLAHAEELLRRWGGKAARADAAKWLKPSPRTALRFGSVLQVLDEPSARSQKIPSLYIPHGLAFGSGEHATTSMLLRALCRRRLDLARMKILDVGTGSGILALAARSLGGRNIVGTDFDAQAIATARRNESGNFPHGLIHWHHSDVNSLRASARYDLVLANLYSGVLCEAAPALAACLKPHGELWLSGILRDQHDEVVATYKRAGMKLSRTHVRGKWVMTQWQLGRA